MPVLTMIDAAGWLHILLVSDDVDVVLHSALGDVVAAEPSGILGIESPWASRSVWQYE